MGSTSAARPLPQLSPSLRLTESLCTYILFSYVIVWHEEVSEFHADHHNGTQVCHLIEAVIDDTGSEEGIYAFIYCTKWRSGQVLPMPEGRTHPQLIDRATQLLIKYKSGALVTQLQSYQVSVIDKKCQRSDWSH